MRRLLPVLLVGLMAMTGAAAAIGQGNGNGSSQAASNSQAGANSQAGTHSQGQGQANGQSQSTQTQTQTQTFNSSSGGGQTQAGTTSSERGANQSGPFTSDPSAKEQPSGNGNSTNNNSHKPCAGCVGNADDKNPPGQSPNDHNRGYECDQNQGVGQGNPAHTGCTTTQVTPPEEPGRNANEVAAQQQQQAQPPAAVLGEQEAGENPAENPQPEHAESPGQNVSRKLSLPRTHRELPFTGLALLFMALLGGTMIAIGRGLESVVPGDARR